MKASLGSATAVLVVAMTVPVFGQQSTVIEKDQQALTELSSKWVAAYNRKDAAGVVAVYTEDAVEVGPLGIFEGRSAIQKRIEGDIQAGGHDLSVSKTRLMTSGNMAFTAGEWSLQFGSQPAHGYYQTSSVRDGDTFKIRQFAFTFALPEPAPAQSASKTQ